MMGHGSLKSHDQSHDLSFPPTWVRWEYPSLSRKLSRSSRRGGSSPKKLLNLRKLEMDPRRKGPWDVDVDGAGESIVLERCRVRRGDGGRDGENIIYEHDYVLRNSINKT